MESKTRSPKNTDVDVGEPPDDLMRAVFRGLRWKTLTRIVMLITHVVMLVVLSRLLTPTDYGIAGMALVVTSFVVMFTDPALGAALVQRPTIDERDRSTVFWLTASLGAALTILGVAASGLVADFFGEAQVKELFAVSSLCFFVLSLSVVHRSILIRRLAYRSLEIREMIAIIAGGATAVAIAFAGFGPWAIVANFVVHSLASTVLFWLLLDWRPRARFSAERARNLTGFSARILSASVLSWGDQNLDKAFVGRFLGSSALGAYSLAYTAQLIPMALLGRPLHGVLAPAYSRIQGDKERLERAWLRSKRVSVAIVSPSLLALIVVAPDFVHVVFGNQWDDAIVPLQLLCAGGVAGSLTTLNWSLLQARGEAATLLTLTVASSAVIWVAFAAGLTWGIVGVAASYASAKWLLVVPATWITTRGVSFDFWAALRAGAEMLPAALGAAGVALAARHLLLETAVPEFVRLLAVGAVMLVAYGATVLVTAPSLIREIQLVLRTTAHESDPLHQQA